MENVSTGNFQLIELVAHFGFFSTGEALPLKDFPQKIWSQNGKKASIMIQICITVDSAVPGKIPEGK